MFSSTVLVFLASALFLTSNAADFVVQAGVAPPAGQNGHRYSPDHVYGAVPGDTITFQFLPSGHTATQGMLATPCTPLAGGFNSGHRAGATTPDASDTFQLTVNSTDPIWVYCSTPGHCAGGMVFAANPASDAQLAQFQQNAATSGALSSTTTGAASSASSACTGGGSEDGPSCGPGFSVAQVVPAILMTALAGTFGALLM